MKKPLRKKTSKWKNGENVDSAVVYALIVLLLLAGLMLVGQEYSRHRKLSEARELADIKTNVFQLYSQSGTCSGIKVKADSGKTYVLTAGHCRDLIYKGNKIGRIDATGEEEIKVTLVEEDRHSDLMLLTYEGILGGLKIAQDVQIGEDARAFAHSRGDGKLPVMSVAKITSYQWVGAPVLHVSSTSELGMCSAYSKYIFDVVNNLCYLNFRAAVYGTKLKKGNSGSGVVNDRGELIGIVSMIDDQNTYLVTLQDIKMFMRNK